MNLGPWRNGARPAGVVGRQPRKKTYPVVVQLTLAQREQLKQRAAKDDRTLTAYCVAQLFPKQ